MGTMAGVGAVAGLAVAGVAGRRAGKNRTSMEAVGVGINGFGRIGRQVARIAMKDPETELKLINASYDSDYLAYMMKYDTIHGKYDGTVEADGDSLVVDGQKIALSHTRDPAEIPFGEHGAEYVCESTGVFLTTEKVQGHLKAGAKKVIFSAPAKDDSHTIVMGVNEDTYDTSMECVSCASCTTNGLAPAVRVLQEKRGNFNFMDEFNTQEPVVSLLDQTTAESSSHDSDTNMRCLRELAGKLRQIEVFEDLRSVLFHGRSVLFDV
eukprot:Skav216192  [mRNA]  locus=scaffold1222:43027:51238:- [translate_table: standard]